MGRQGGQRRVINNNYNEAMDFEVVGGAAACEYRWTWTAMATAPGMLWQIIKGSQ